MKDKIIKEALTEQEAIQQAIRELNALEDEVVVEVLEKSRKGFFGIGKKLAKVCVSLRQMRDLNKVQDEMFRGKLIKSEYELENIPIKETKKKQEEILTQNNLSIYGGLNKEQMQAVTTTEGYIRVIAGAGTGKTKALTYRYMYLVKELGICTTNILCVTFTNKAAQEMKKRIRRMIGDYDTGFIATFHGFCAQLLREDIHVINYPSSFVIIDAGDRETILKTIYQDSNISSREYTFSQALEIITSRKRLTPYIDEMIVLDIMELKNKYINAVDTVDKIFYGYLYEQRKCYALDFDDLLLVALYILKNYNKKKEKWQEKLQYVLVDEFQDVSASQYELVSILSTYHKNLFIVGDPDQTIYSWRGARVDYIVQFDKMFPDVKTVIMERNYRSSNSILRASNSLIEKNTQRIDKNLFAIKKDSIPITYFHARTIVLEATWIASKIKNLVANGVEYKDIAILYRAHYVSRSLEEIMVKENIPYVLYSGVEFYKRKEIKDILSYLRMIVFADDLSLLRVINEPKRKVGNKRIALLKEYAEENSCSLYTALKSNLDDGLISKSGAKDFFNVIDKYQKIYKEMKITDVLSGIMNDSGYEAMLRQSGEDERLDNIAELKQAISEYENMAGEDVSLEDYLQKVALYSNSDRQESKNSIKMMTIHTAKGLEFPAVFIVGLNEGTFPNKRADTLEKLEEERRLAYVAMTRAEKYLFLTESEGINYDGSFRLPSRFLFNIERKYIKYEVELPTELEQSAQVFIKASEEQLKDINKVFEVGDKIRHKIFGAGEIIKVNKCENIYTIQFDKQETPRSIKEVKLLERIE